MSGPKKRGQIYFLSDGGWNTSPCQFGLLDEKMPRLGRVVLPNYPHHVVQRGHNKQVVFAEEADYLHYLNTLEAFKVLYDVKVYGFCLMTNQFTLFCNPETQWLGWVS